MATSLVKKDVPFLCQFPAGYEVSTSKPPKLLVARSRNTGLFLVSSQRFLPLTPPAIIPGNWTSPLPNYLQNEVQRGHVQTAWTIKEFVLPISCHLTRVSRAGSPYITPCIEIPVVPIAKPSFCWLTPIPRYRKYRWFDTAAHVIVRGKPWQNNMENHILNPMFVASTEIYPKMTIDQRWLDHKCSYRRETNPPCSQHLAKACSSRLRCGKTTVYPLVYKVVPLQI